MMRLLFLFIFFVSAQYPLHGQYFLSKAIVDSFRIKTFVSYQGEGDDRRLLSRTTYDTSGKTTSTCRVYYSDSTTRFHRDTFITRGDVFVTWHIAGSRMDSSVTTHRTENGWRMTTTESYMDGVMFSRELHLRDSTKSVYMTEHLGSNFYCLVTRANSTYNAQGRRTSVEWTDSIISPQARWQMAHERHEYIYTDEWTCEKRFVGDKGKLRLQEVIYWNNITGADSTISYNHKGKIELITVTKTDSLQRYTLRETRTRKGQTETRTTTEYFPKHSVERLFTNANDLIRTHTFYYDSNGLCIAETRQSGEMGATDYTYYEYEFY